MKVLVLDAYLRNTPETSLHMNYCSSGFGWNRELIDSLSSYLDLEEVDLLDEEEVAEVWLKLVDLLKDRRVRRFLSSSSGFLLDFFPSATIPPDFATFLRHLPYESVRILLIFFANQFRFTYLRTSDPEKQDCPFCSGQLSSEHFFTCPSTPPPFNDWQGVISGFNSGNYWEAVDRIFLTLQRWASVCQNFAWGFLDKVMEYFQYTEFQVVRRNRRS